MLADLAKEAMLDGIPLGGAGGIMTDRDAQLIGIHQLFLQGEFPGATARTIAASTVSQDQQLGSFGVTMTALPTPPLADGFHGEGRSVVRRAHDDPPAVGVQIVDPIGNGHAFCLRTEIMVLNQDRVAAPHPAVVLKLAHQFLFLGVHTDDRIAAPGELLSLVVEEAELLIAQRTGLGTKAFAVRVQSVAHFVQQTPDRVRTNAQTKLTQLRTDVAEPFPGPHAALAHRIPCGVLSQQSPKPVQDFRRFFSTAARPPPCCRTRPCSTWPLSNSRSPRATVSTSRPKRCAARCWPPWPHCKLSKPA